MANHQLLFGRPLVADETLPPLSVTGALGGYTSGEAYDSELDINNSVGRCTLTVIENTLPPGARVFIDQLRKKVVVRWDAYTPPVETVQLVPNGDFEAGDDGRWSLGPGWTIGSGADYPVQDGTHSARFKDYKGTSDMVLASVPAKTNDYIKIDAMIQHGASSEGNVGARVSLIWRAEDGRELDRNWGNYISSGSKGAWKTSTAEGYGPGDARYVSVVLSAKRSRQNHGLFVDKIMWNHEYAVGQEDDSDYSLYIKVRDGANRVAYWRGSIGIDATYVIAQLYPLSVYDTAAACMPSTSLSFGAGANLLDYAAAGMPGIVSLTSRTATLRIAVLEETSSITGMPHVAALSRQSAVSRVVLPQEDYSKASVPTINGGTSSKDVVRASGGIDNTKAGMPTIYGMTQT